MVDETENIVAGELKDVDKIKEHLVFRYLFGVITRGEFLWFRPSEGITSYKDYSINWGNMRESAVEFNMY